MHALAKLVGFLLEPLNLLVVLTLAGAVLAPVRLRLAAVPWGAAGLLLVLVTATPLPEWSLRVLEDRFPPRHVAVEAVGGAVVLGGATGSATLAAARDTYLLGDAAERLTAAAGLARRHPELPVVVAGFSAAVWHRGWSEAEMTRRLMAELGLPPDRFLYEERSRTTFENARYTAARIATDRPWLLVTSAFHMPRAVASFRAAGVEVVPYPVDWRAPRVDWRALRPNATARFDWARLALKEWVGLVVYRLLGRTDTLFPAPRSAAAEAVEHGVGEAAAAGVAAQLDG